MEYEIFNYYDEVQSQVHHTTNLLNYYPNKKIEKFLSYCNKDNYLYLCEDNLDNNIINNYQEIKEILIEIGFTSKKIKDIKELYIFPMMLDGFFSYLVFEKYSSDNKLTELDLLILTTICKTISSKIETDEIIKKYREDVLMKDVILQNEQIPMAVVEKDTFKILYFNDLYYNVLPNIELGKPCYEFFGQTKKCTDCCIDKQQILNNINSDDHQWIKKATAFKMSNGKDAYMIYTTDSIDYVKQLNDLDELTKSLLFVSFKKYYQNFIQKSGFNYALCNLDVDKFKYINSIFGYKIGDSVLKNIAIVIRDFVDADENFCRVGEDKFSIFLRYETDEHLKLKLDELFIKFSEMKNKLFPDIKITIAGGITKVDKSKTLNILLDQSTIARKNAKGSINNNFKFYT